MRGALNENLSQVRQSD
jgi:hypothetical protein